MTAIKQDIVNITYSNIVESVSLWNSTTNYLLGDLVRVGYYHYKSTYGALGTYNIGNNPLDTLDVDWVLWEPSNTYACLDLYSQTKTEWTGDGIIEFLRGTKNKIAIGNFIARQVTVEYLDSSHNVLDEYTQIYNFSTNLYIYDEWDYAYADFSDTFSEVIYKPLYLVGTTIRVTLTNNGNATSLGYLVSGKAESFGTTYGDISQPDLRVGDTSINNATFDTYIEDFKHTRTVRRGKSLINEPMLFIVDDTENSVHNNIIILGKITKCEGVASSYDRNTIAWTIEQNIIE